jgi:hypothetical protein
MKKFTPWVLTILGGLLFAYFLAKTDLEATWGHIRQADLGLLALSFLLVVAMIYVKGVRWSYLLKMQGVSYPVWDSFLIYLGSLFWGTFTPGRAGDFMKVLYLKRDRNLGIGMGMSSVLVDRVFDLYILLILGCVGLLLNPLSDNPHLVRGVWLFFALLLAVSFLAFHKKTGEWLMKTVFQKALGDRLHGHADQAFRDFHKGMASFYRWTLLWPVVLTVLSYVVFFIGCWLMAHALGIEISAFYLAFCIAVVNIVSLLSFAGVGTREGALLLLFGLHQIPQSQTMAFDGVFFFIGSALICVLGFLAYLMKPVKFDKDSPLSGAA